MPEGPEIQIACDKLRRVLQGEKVKEISLPWEPLQDYSGRWLGCRIEKLQARGKALLTFFCNGDILYSHNQLYGRWLTRKNGVEPKSNRSLRVALITDKGGAFLYSATDLEVLTEGELDKHPYLKKLGPDILEPGLKAGHISRRLQSKRFRNRQLASLYLDQSFLAGPGNYLRSEILFAASLHPRSKPSRLESKQRLELARKTLELSQRAYRTKGFTVPSELAEKLKSRGLPRRARRHYVFGREGRLCHRCGESEVGKMVISSRSVFYCPTCQPPNE